MQSKSMQTCWWLCIISIKEVSIKEVLKKFQILKKLYQYVLKWVQDIDRKQKLLEKGRKRSDEKDKTFA